jgi:predicted dehydrogenase
MKGKELGVAIVGAGRIGALRASLVTTHPAVSFVAISDLNPKRAKALAAKVDAQLSSGDNLEVISRPEVNAVIVSTSEHEHTVPVLQALERGKDVLVEKPIAINLEDAGRILAAAERAEGSLRIGYSRRFQRHYLLAKEQIAGGHLGQVLSGTARIYNSRAQTFQILMRSPGATPVIDSLTYYVDLLCWFMEGNPPVEVTARSQGKVFRAEGYNVDDTTWSILTFADGAVVSLGLNVALPEKYPTLGPSARIEILGTEGALLFDDDHREHILYTSQGIPHSYVPGHGLNMAFLGSTAPGDWALGDFWGPLASETRSWLDYLATGRPCALATPEEACKTLEVTLAIERAAQSKQTVRLPLDKER